MGFWIFMLITAMLLPVTMLGFGKLFLKQSPKNINSVFGYRTTMSMKNKDTWEFAHKHFGKTWYRCGLVMLPLSIAAMFLAFGKSDDVTGIVGTVIQMIQIAILIGAIYPTEKALREHFDKDGNRK